MVIKELSLPDNIFTSKLHAQMWNLQADASYDPSFIRLLLAILKIDLLNVDSEKLKNSFSKDFLWKITELDIQAATSNTELIARVLDIKMLIRRSFIKSKVKTAVANYLAVFDATNSYSYLIRAIALVRMGRQLFANQMSELQEKSTQVAIELPYPFWQHQLVLQLVQTFEKETIRNRVSSVIQQRLQELSKTDDISGAQLCLDSLNVLGVLNDDEAAINKALLFEQEADRIIAARQANTFYPTISQKFTRALHLIKHLPNCQELKRRIIDKLHQAQLDDIRMVSLAGVKVSSHIDFQDILSAVAATEIKSFNEAFSILLSLPIPAIAKETEGSDSTSSFLDRAFSTHVKLSEQGKPVGTQEGHAAKDNQTRMQLREYLIALIKMLKDVMDIYGTLDNQQVFELLLELKSPFIASTRASLYAMGLGAGFNGNFLEAAHLLIPQLEHSFRHIATSSGISVTNFSNTQEQLENTMGGTLQKIEAIVDPNLFAELQSFLLDGSSVNFRNELVHGIMSPKLIEHYGYYTWWLSLKLIYNSKTLFNVSDKNST